MPRIRIANWKDKTWEVTDLTKPLLQHIQEHGLDWMHACGGKGRCTTCKVIVQEGAENFPAITPAEQRYIDMGALKSPERLACQVRIKDDVVISVPEEYKLPHISYS
jgi:ferredoxin, 2Fe-2S